MNRHDTGFFLPLLDWDFRPEALGQTINDSGGQNGNSGEIIVRTMNTREKAGGPGKEESAVMTIKASQEILTEQEVSRLTGLCESMAFQPFRANCLGCPVPALPALRRHSPGIDSNRLRIESHLEPYSFQFVANATPCRRLSNLGVLIKGMKPHAEEEKVEKQWACGEANPK